MASWWVRGLLNAYTPSTSSTINLSDSDLYAFFPSNQAAVQNIVNAIIPMIMHNSEYSNMPDSRTMSPTKLRTIN